MLHIRAEKLPTPETEFRFDPVRRWRFDFAWPMHFVACEVEGGIWTNGRHSRGAGMQADMVKYNAATAAGWRVFRVTEALIKDGSATKWIREALA